MSVTEAPPYSLILLDEPEVSLHPGAQRKLMDFLAEQSKSRYQQIVISTHSPEIIADLPPNAIKVFLPSPTDGKVELLSQASHPAEAFFRLGTRPADAKRIYVEDGLAAEVVRRAIRSLGEAQNSRLQIIALPGGTNSIQTRFIPAFALSNYRNCLVFLDGDQRPLGAIPSPKSVGDTELSDVVSRLLHGEPQLLPSGRGGASAAGEKTAQLRRILEWYVRNVDFLPGSDPESLLLQLEVGSDGLVMKPAEAKAEWARRARIAVGTPEWEQVPSQEILGEQKRLLARLDEGAEAFEQIRARVRKLLETDEE